MRPRSWRCWPLVTLLLLAFVIPAAEAGHESPFYPSFYPQEITIQRVDPKSAASLLEKSAIHAYVGGDPFASTAIPPNVTAAESLGSFVVLTFDPRAAAFADGRARCLAARSFLGALAKAKAPYVVYPYPVTPYHEDYLGHADLVAAEASRYAQGAPSGPVPRVRAKGALARALVPTATDGPAQATFEEIDADALTAAHRAGSESRLGPPWIKQGWFQAHLLLADTLVGDAARRGIEAVHERLVTGGYADARERLQLERDLVSLLTRGCERVVVGYTVRREYYSVEYSAGIENVAADSHAGLRSPIFLRTAKLKDFPWNGWLRIGVPTASSSAWNPIAGFTDPTGGLVWFGLGDPAMLPAPRGGGWITNRVTSVQMTRPQSGSLGVPPEAVRPEEGTGALRRLDPAKDAAAKLLYRVAMSAFHDGSRMTVADLVYRYVFAYRWSASGHGAGRYDPVVDRSTRMLRDWLVGFRVLKVDTETKRYGEDLEFTYEIPVVEVYLAHGVADVSEAAVVAPPWSGVPWHLLALMEAAVQRGAAAFSDVEARRRGVPWLDLARNPKLARELRVLVEAFARNRYVPDVLKAFVTPDEAARRWERLRRFYAQHGHFLVTNGPYRLSKWSDDSVVLSVFRDLTYPIGVGSFDRYAIPLRAFVSRMENRGGRLEVEAETETISKYQRTYEIVRQRVQGKPVGESDPQFPECRWVVIGADGRVARVGTSRYTTAGTLAIDLRGALPPGRYTVLAALYSGDNAVSPEVKMVEYRVPGS